MTPQQLVILAAAGMLLGLALSRVVRVGRGLPPHIEGWGRIPFILAFLLVPPIGLELVVNPTAAQGKVHGIESVLLYIAALGILWIPMGIAALVVRLVAHGRTRAILMLALVGSEGDPDDIPFDPPLSPRLAEELAVVDRANAAFPRGLDFPGQIDPPGFRGRWATLDEATQALEATIAEDRRLGVAVAWAATSTAKDARGRLETLRRLAIDRGQAWAA